MTAKPDLLPLPAEFGHPSLQALGIVAENYARANLAELQREVEGLRAEVETRKEDYATLTAMWRADEAKYRDLAEQAVARAERLAEALRIAIRQNSHDMLMTGDELRQCEAALNRTAAQENDDA